IVHCDWGRNNTVNTSSTCSSRVKFRAPPSQQRQEETPKRSTGEQWTAAVGVGDGWGAAGGRGVSEPVPSDKSAYISICDESPGGKRGLSAALITDGMPWPTQQQHHHQLGFAAQCLKCSRL
ncbi:hypothetical protein JMJ77_0009446, partial [Colletotrichum scovillei]